MLPQTSVPSGSPQSPEKGRGCTSISDGSVAGLFLLIEATMMRFPRTRNTSASRGMRPSSFRRMLAAQHASAPRRPELNTEPAGSDRFSRPYEFSPRT